MIMRQRNFSKLGYEGSDTAGGYLIGMVDV